MKKNLHLQFEREGEKRVLYNGPECVAIGYDAEAFSVAAISWFKTQCAELEKPLPRLPNGWPKLPHVK